MVGILRNPEIMRAFAISASLWYFTAAAVAQVADRPQPHAYRVVRSPHLTYPVTVPTHVAQVDPGQLSLPQGDPDAAQQLLNRLLDQQQSRQLTNPAQFDAATPSPVGTPRPSESVRIPIGDQSAARELQVTNDEGRLSLVVREAPLADVLTMIAKTQGLNLVAPPDIDTVVTHTLEKVSVEDALDAILSIAGFTWTQRNGIIYVTRISEGTGLTPGIQGLQMRMFELDFAKASEVQTAIAEFLSPAGRSAISEVSPTDNRKTKEAIVVEDIPQYLQRIEEYIYQLDQPPRQVMIQVHILEVDLDGDLRHGVNFDQLLRVAGARLNVGTEGFANALAPQMSFLQLAEGDLGAFIEALKTTTDAKTLAAPRVLAVNGQQARFQVGERLGFRVTTATETSSLESVEFLDVGVVVEVTPRITRDGRIMMHIKPEVSGGEVNPETGLPQEETTEVTTNVLLDNGQAMVLGGLIQELESTTISKVPLLGDIKFVGFFFQRRRVQRTRSEVIVALVPHILPYCCDEQVRNDLEVGRAFDPLLCGPLCRYPRPYEPRLHDCLRDTCLGDRGGFLRDRIANPQHSHASLPSRTLVQRLPSVEPAARAPQSILPIHRRAATDPPANAVIHSARAPVSSGPPAPGYR